ncbi:MarR family transcriptional regulator [Porticoccaceae bacterium]|nr:MarR family transcriptional regulator [Porticoccaceae bacterium]
MANIDMISLARRFAILPRLLSKRLDSQLEPFNVAVGSYPYLLTVFYNSGCSGQVIADKLRTDKAAVARALQKLLADGYLSRHKDPQNARQWQLFCTEKGHDFCRHVEQIVQRELEQVMRPLSSQQKRQLFEIMELLVTLDSR